MDAGGSSPARAGGEAAEGDFFDCEGERLFSYRFHDDLTSG